MISNPKKYHKIINDIELKMIKEKDKIWIKIEPTKRKSEPSELYIIINNEKYNYEIYDKKGSESCKIYFHSKKANPSFLLKNKHKNFRIQFKSNGIKIIKINKIQNIDDYITKNCNCKSSQVLCWGNAVYYTSRPEKAPFNEM